MIDLSIIIPSRSKKYLQPTIDDVLKHAEGNIEILVGLDDFKEDFIIYHHPKIHWEYRNKPIGQRKMMNILAKKAEGRYLMKLDAHVSLSQGFDIQMLKDIDDNSVLVPALCKLNPETWTIAPKPISSNFYLDTDLVFQYGENKSELVHEIMTIQGSGFMVSRDKYFELGLCDESLGSWGMQGTEVALKTWLSGGKVLSTKNAYMGHYFRMFEDGGQGFPYERDMNKINETFRKVKEMFLNNKWSKQTKSIQWLVEKFNYPLNWTKEFVDSLPDML
jgi:glycosyltransferase involved in cell wall biosynthesis